MLIRSRSHSVGASSLARAAFAFSLVVILWPAPQGAAAIEDPLRLGQTALEPAFQMIPPPSSIGELAHFYNDLLVVGTATAVDRHRTIIYYSEVFGQLADKLFNPSMPFDSDVTEQVTDYRVKITRVLIDRGDATKSSPEIIVRMLRGSSVPVIGQEYLFSVLHNDDEPGDTYSSFFGPRSMFYTDGTTIRYSDGNAVPYLCALTFDYFLDALLVADKPADRASLVQSQWKPANQVSLVSSPLNPAERLSIQAVRH